MCADAAFFSQAQSVGHILTPWMHVALLTVSSFLLLAVALLPAFRRASRSFGLLLSLFCFVLGFGLTDAALSFTSLSFEKEKRVYQLLIDEHPEEKERSLLCHARLEGRVSPDGLQSYEKPRRVLLYFPLSAADSLQRGYRLWVHTSLQLPSKSGNPDEFDYARYLLRNGNSATAYIAPGKWVLKERESARTLRQLAEDCRAEVMAIYARLGISGDKLAVLSALTVGEKGDLSEEIRETYSVAGAAHVLALSGMHVGILYAVLTGLFSLFTRCVALLFGSNRLFASLAGNPSSREWGRLCILPCLWAFAFVTGFSPSVVRAVAMCSLLTVGKVYLANVYRVSGVNIVAATAFFMLLCRPLWLFDVGFQLSFAAVTSMLLLHPHLSRMFRFRRSWARKLWDVVSISLAAQIGAAPLVALYFSRFSTHFLLANICVLIPVTLIVCAALALLLLAPLPALQQVVGKGVDLLLDVQHTLLAGIERLPYASVDGLWLGVWEVVAFYLLMWFLFRVWRFPTARNLLTLLGCLLVVVSCRLVEEVHNTPSPHIAIYHVRNAPAVHCVGGNGQSWLVAADSLCDFSRLRRSLNPHWNRLRLDVPQVVVTDCRHRELYFKNNLLCYRGQRICLLNDSRWAGKRIASPLRVDCLYITRGYKGKVSDVMGIFRLRTVVLDASLPAYRRRKLQTECARLGIPCYSVPERGAWTKFV